MKMAAKFLFLTLLLVNLEGCNRVTKPPGLKGEAYLWIPANKTMVDKELQMVGLLCSDIQIMLQDYLEGGQEKKVSFVSPAVYVSFIDGDSETSRTIGIVLEGGNKLFGVDITGVDASKALITGVHRVVVNAELTHNPTLEKYFVNVLAQSEALGFRRISPAAKEQEK